MSNPSHRPIFHFVTPDPHPSPFDVNMAVDAGFHVTCYTHVSLAEVTGLAQDAVFSRPPDAAPFTCLFIGGRQIGLAMDMLAAVKAACVPPFTISAFADPSGAFTTAAALIAAIEGKLRPHHGTLNGKKLAIFGGRGVVGGLAGVIAARQGARVTLVGHSSLASVAERAAEYLHYFQVSLAVADGGSPAQRAAILAECEIVIAAARAGAQVLTASEIKAAKNLLVAADCNAVPPAGIDSVGVFDDGVPIPGHENRALGLGALAVGGIKFRTQHAMLHDLAFGGVARHFDFTDALDFARQMVAHK
ncbi:MAG: methylenetetrahydromethanopterin dehydrogenase [Candidatus Symbiobacter sp.]|nr:methylenetetrahydromethanopterin dehydrogenase [Candidatus Symbiobacter sp.]